MPYEPIKCPSCQSVDVKLTDGERGIYRCEHCGTSFSWKPGAGELERPPSRGILNKLSDYVNDPEPEPTPEREREALAESLAELEAASRSSRRFVPTAGGLAIFGAMAAILARILEQRGLFAAGLIVLAAALMLEVLVLVASIASKSECARIEQKIAELDEKIGKN